MRIHRNEQPFSCNICHKVYNAMSSLKTHQRMAHRDVTAASGAVSTTSASVTSIDNGGASIVSTTTTIADSTGAEANAVLCPVCNKAFSKPHLMSAHMAVHDKNRPLACQYCSYRFNSTAKMNVHMRQHMEAGETVLQAVDDEQPDDDSSDDKLQDMAME